MVEFPEQRQGWLGHGEPGSEWQEVRGGQEPDLVEPHR